MGAEEFYARESAKTAKEAFRKAVEKAQWEHGHSGYTGSIAEKDSFVIINIPTGKTGQEYAEELLENEDPRIRNKWGPAGCILVEESKDENEYLFFGIASC